MSGGRKIWVDVLSGSHEGRFLHQYAHGPRPEPAGTVELEWSLAAVRNWVRKATRGEVAFTVEAEDIEDFRALYRQAFVDVYEDRDGD